MAEALRYKDKVTIVTGEARGLVEAAWRYLFSTGQRSCSVPEEVNSSNYSSKGMTIDPKQKTIDRDEVEAEGRALETEVNRAGPGEAHYVQCDMTNEDDIKALINITVEKYGQIDCVINNAGWHPPPKTIDDFSADDFRQLLDLNLVSYFLVAKYSLPHLRKTKGCIIQDSSLVAEIGQSHASTYVATKGGVTSLTKALAVEEAPNGVRVNTFAPGNVWTPMWDAGCAASSDYEKTYKAGENAQLMGRYGTIEECGKACLFLAADATFCTGINILMSGGAELNYGVKNPRAIAESGFVNW